MQIVTLCADDFGLNEAVSRAIIELAEAGRLSAISCMSASPHWREHAAWLAPLRDRIDIGLHLTLTELRPVGPMPVFAPGGTLPNLLDVLRDGLLHRLPRDEIETELRRQMNAYMESFGHAPDFIDGHQHVHVLPGVRETVLDLWEEFLKPNKGYVRSCREPAAAILRRGVQPAKALLISTLSTQLTRQAQHRRVPTNDSFRGVHDFSGNVPPQKLFSRFLRGGGARPLLMCHPGHGTHASEDVLHDWRPREFAYLSSAQFQSDLHAAGVRLSRLPR